MRPAGALSRGRCGSLTRIVENAVGLIVVNAESHHAGVDADPSGSNTQLQQMGSVQQRSLTLEQKEGVVRRMAQNQMLAYEAVKAGLQGDPEIAEAVRGALVQRLLHREVEAQVTPPPESGRPPARYRLRGPFPSAPPRTGHACFPGTQLSSACVSPGLAF